jgi:hypothetical protein
MVAPTFPDVPFPQPPPFPPPALVHVPHALAAAPRPVSRHERKLLAQLEHRAAEVANARPDALLDRAKGDD